MDQSISVLRYSLNFSNDHGTRRLVWFFLWFKKVTAKVEVGAAHNGLMVKKEKFICENVWKGAILLNCFKKHTCIICKCSTTSISFLNLGGINNYKLSSVKNPFHGMSQYLYCTLCSCPNGDKYEWFKGQPKKHYNVSEFLGKWIFMDVQLCFSLWIFIITP